jgi:hypothetical protein
MMVVFMGVLITGIMTLVRAAKIMLMKMEHPQQ